MCALFVDLQNLQFWRQIAEAKQNYFCFTSSWIIMFSLTNRVAVKDIGPFIPANCTESRDGHNGHIPGAQNPKIHITNNNKCVICAKFLR
mgnify:CR=1 FL=1